MTDKVIEIHNTSSSTIPEICICDCDDFTISTTTSANSLNIDDLKLKVCRGRIYLFLILMRNTLQYSFFFKYNDKRIRIIQFGQDEVGSDNEQFS